MKRIIFLLLILSISITACSKQVDQPKQTQPEKQQVQQQEQQNANLQTVKPRENLPENPDPNMEYTFLLGNVGSECEVANDCQTPGQYLVQSNCPFSSACIDNKCKVVCPVFEQSKKTCKVDNDCNCSWRGEKTKSCKCITGTCYSVEAE